MAGLGIHTENPAFLRRGEKGFSQLESEFVGSDLIAEIGPLRGQLAVLADDHALQVRAILARPHIDRAPLRVIEELDGVDPAGVDTLQVHSNEFLQPTGARDRMRHAVLAAEVEIVEPVRPLFVTRGDLVEFVLQCGGEVEVHQTTEVLLEQTGHRKGNPRRNQRGALLVHVPAVLNSFDDRGIR